MSSWHNYPKVFAIGHAGIRDLFLDPVTIEEKIDGCVTPDTPILTSELRYRPAGELRIGDVLVGFSETLNNPKLRESVVTASVPMSKPCARVLFGDREVVASLDHPWLVRQKTNNNGKRWVETKDLLPGMAIVAMPVWKENDTREAGYVAGFFDGEGSLVRHENQRILSVYQRTGDTLNHIIALLAAGGYRFNLDVRRRRDDWAQVGSLVLREGTWTQILRFLGEYRPVRLLADAKKIWLEAPLNYVPDSVVVSVDQVGERTVQGLSTSSKTYIANGLFSHNSQFSFGVIDDVLRCRSKGQELITSAPEKMFAKAVETAMQLSQLLKPGWTYRAEYLQTPKHNTLAYDRIPARHLIVFDINTGQEQYLSYEEKAAEAARIGLECVPLLYRGQLSSPEELLSLLEKTSVLGSQRVEGVVAKNYVRFGLDGKALMGKYVSEAFKEIHAGNWRKRIPKNGDIIALLTASLRTPTRWDKALQHLRESGKLDGSPKDIGPLMREVPTDTEQECAAEVKEKLFAWAWPQIQRGITAGLPQWYKDKLLADGFKKAG